MVNLRYKDSHMGVGHEGGRERHEGGVTGQNGIGQNGTDKMVATFIDSNSTELSFYSVITSNK